jgi:hypothetical protein
MGEVRIWHIASAVDGKPSAQWKSPDFTSWGTTKTHHYCGGIYGLAFSPDGEVLLCCGMGPMGTPWRGMENDVAAVGLAQGRALGSNQGWPAWIRIDGKRGLASSGDALRHGRRQAQGTWNAAVFSALDGALVTSVDSKKRITHARFIAEGNALIISGATGQGTQSRVFGPTGAEFRRIKSRRNRRHAAAKQTVLRHLFASCGAMEASLQKRRVSLPC